MTRWSTVNTWLRLTLRKATGLNFCSTWVAANDHGHAQRDYRADRRNSPRPPQPPLPAWKRYDLREGGVLQSRRQRQRPDLPQHDQRGGAAGKVETRWHYR